MDLLIKRPPLSFLINAVSWNETSGHSNYRAFRLPCLQTTVPLLNAVSRSFLDYRTAVFVLLLVKAEGQPDVKERSLAVIRLFVWKIRTNGIIEVAAAHNGEVPHPNVQTHAANAQPRWVRQSILLGKSVKDAVLGARARSLGRAERHYTTPS